MIKASSTRSAPAVQTPLLARRVSTTSPSTPREGRHLRLGASKERYGKLARATSGAIVSSIDAIAPRTRKGMHRREKKSPRRDDLRHRL
jgi:hypothetical protein